MELHSLYWPDMNPEIVALHKACFEHIGVEVRYSVEKTRHSLWMDRILRERLPHSDIVGFVDIDCLAYDKASIDAAADWVRRTGSFLGLAQSANHLRNSTKVYAAPSFILISRHAFEALKCPSMLDGPYGDVGQALSSAADSVRFVYRVLYPIGFYGAAPVWQLGNYGSYGPGTEYEGGFYHNFNSRFTAGLDLIRDRASAILSDEPQPSRLPHMSRSLCEEADVSRPQPASLRSRLRDRYHALRRWAALRVKPELRS